MDEDHESATRLPEEANCLTKEVLTEVLKTKEKTDDVVVKSFSMISMRNFDECYTGYIFRIRVSAQKGDNVTDRHLLAKIAHAKGTESKHGRSSKLFDKEHLFYSTLLPHMVDMQVNNDRPVTVNTPTVWKSVVSDKIAYIVMDECTFDGFATVPYDGNFDYDHCEIVVKEIAKLHALSLAIEFDSTERGSYSYGLLHEENLFSGETSRLIFPLMKYAVHTCAKIFAAVFKDETKVKAVVDVLQNIDIPKFIRNSVKPDNVLDVFCHRDPNTKNVLFRYEKTELSTVVEAKLIDFQTVHYGPAASDLTYFIFNNTTASFRREHLNDILKTYHQTLIDSLKVLNTNVPGLTFDVLRQQFDKYSLFGMFCRFSLHFLYSKTVSPPDFMAINNDFDGIVAKSCEALMKTGEDEEIVQCLLEAIENGF